MCEIAESLEELNINKKIYAIFSAPQKCNRKTSLHNSNLDGIMNIQGDSKKSTYL